MGKPIDLDMIESPTQEHRNFHSTDKELREHGFHIASRPNRGQAVWERNGKRFTQDQAEQETMKEK